MVDRPARKNGIERDTQCQTDTEAEAHGHGGRLQRCTQYRTPRCAKGEAVFREGDDPGGVVAIVTGRVKVWVTGVGGREVWAVRVSWVVVGPGLAPARR